MRTTELFLDPADPKLVHASLTCTRNVALIDLAATSAVDELADPEELLGIVEQLGYTVPVWAARGMNYCSHCTLVRDHPLGGGRVSVLGSLDVAFEIVTGR